MSPLLKNLLKLIVNPPKALLQRAVTEDGYKIEWGTRVWGVHPLLSEPFPIYFEGKLDDPEIKLYLKLINAKEHER